VNANSGIKQKQQPLNPALAAAQLYGPNQLPGGGKGHTASTPTARSAGDSGLCSLEVQVKLDLQPHLVRRASAGRVGRGLDKEGWEAGAGGSQFP